MRLAAPPGFAPATTSRFSGAAFRLLVDEPGEIRLAAEQLAKIDDVEAEQGALPRRHDRRVARTATQQCHLTEEFARPEDDPPAPPLDFALTRATEIHTL